MAQTENDLISVFNRILYIPTNGHFAESVFSIECFNFMLKQMFLKIFNTVPSIKLKITFLKSTRDLKDFLTLGEIWVCLAV